MKEKTSTFTMRLPEDLKKAFEEATKADDVPAAQIIRLWMREYVKNHKQAEFQFSKKGK